MSKKIFVVANPAAGKKNIEPVLRDLVDYLSSYSYDYDVFLTSRSRDGKKVVVENLDQSYTDLVIMGGDGTINQVVNGLSHDIPIGIIPSGNGNDFSKNFDLGSGSEDHIISAIRGKKFRVDMGLCNDRKFVNGVGIGFDGEIVDKITHSKTLLKGFYKYYYHALQILFSYRAQQMKFKFDNGDVIEKKLLILTIANGTTFGGGFKLTPESRVDDGLLTACEVGEIKMVKRFFKLHQIKSGSHHQVPELKHFSLKEMKIETNDAVKAHIDGEFLGVGPYQLRVLPKALTVRAIAIR